jgi:hypothetical protein
MQTTRVEPMLEPRQDALRYILDAWEQALADGLPANIIAYSALCASLSDLVGAYGEDAVAQLTEGLAQRVRDGEFTLFASRH